MLVVHFQNKHLSLLRLIFVVYIIFYIGNPLQNCNYPLWNRGMAALFNIIIIITPGGTMVEMSPIQIPIRVKIVYSPNKYPMTNTSELNTWNNQSFPLGSLPTYHVQIHDGTNKTKPKEITQHLSQGVWKVKGKFVKINFCCLYNLVHRKSVKKL